MIVAVGDSLTRGTVGHSYVKYMNTKTLNKGMNGDCVFGAYRRIKNFLKNSKYSEVKTFIIEIGTNDIFLDELKNVSLFWKIGNTLRPKLFGYHYCVNDDEFIEVYEKIICLLKENNKQIIIVGLPKTEFKNIGLNNLNMKLLTRNRLIEKLAKKYNIRFVDTYKLIDTAMVDGQSGGYAWGKFNFMRCVDGFLFFICPALNDIFSKIRKLNFTVDGIHFNSKTAKMLANEIEKGLE